MSPRKVYQPYFGSKQHPKAGQNTQHVTFLFAASFNLFFYLAKLFKKYRFSNLICDIGIFRPDLIS